MRYVLSYPNALPALSDLLPKIQTRVLIIAGARDPAVPPGNAELLHARLANSSLDIVDAALHLGGRRGRIRGARHELVDPRRVIRCSASTEESPHPLTALRSGSFSRSRSFSDCGTRPTRITSSRSRRSSRGT
jgi:dienelactone hydrolase